VSRVTSTLNSLKAESLLAGSYVLSQIETLRNSLRYQTNGDTVSFDDYYLRLQKEVDDIPRLELKNDVPTGTENQYILQLIKGMEKVQDDADRVVSKIIHYQSKLRNAVSRISRLGAAFNAWYTLAAGEALEENSTKFPSNQLKDLAASEFSRLMENMDVEVNSLLDAVKVQSDQVKLFKKTQQAKFELGKDQANASWTSGLPNFGEAPDRSDQLVARQFEEEPNDDVPDFISKNPQVGTFVPSAEAPTFFAKLPEDALGEVHDKRPTFEEAMRDAIADARLEGQEVSPEVRAMSYDEIKADVDAKDRAVELAQKPTMGEINEEQQAQLIQAQAELGIVAQPASEPKGTFFKTGDPKPLTPVYNDDAPAKTTPVLSITDVFPGAQEVTFPVKSQSSPEVIKKAEKVALTFVPPSGLTLTRTETDGLGKLHCGVCKHRIRTNQVMFERDGEYCHAWEIDCTGKAPVVRGQKKDNAVDPAPITAPLPEAAVHHVVPVLETHTGPVAESTLLDVMEKAAGAASPTGVSLNAMPSLKIPPLTVPVDLSVPEPDVPATPRRRLQFIDEGEDIV